MASLSRVFDLVTQPNNMKPDSGVMLSQEAKYRKSHYKTPVVDQYNPQPQLNATAVQPAESTDPYLRFDNLVKMRKLREYLLF